MLVSIVRLMLRQRLLVMVVSLALCVAGVFAAKNLSVDAFPDVTNIQVQVATVAIGRSPEEVERLVTVPVEIAMTGLPGLVETRSMNKSGLSLITLVFTDDTEVFFARQLVLERLIGVAPTLIPGINPVLGPVSTGLGEVYQYTIEHPDDGKRALTVEELTERRTIQDWVVRPMLRSVQGVAEVNSIGGYVKEYQVLVDPNRLSFASVGGVIGLFITGEYLSVPASVGFIAVWGVAILNGVVLVSFIKELREQGLSVADAVKTSCEARFRPVLITAAATILGLAPFLIATGLGSEVQKPLAIVVICGLITATVMTKVVVPMLYRYFDPMPDVPDKGTAKETNIAKETGHRHRPSLLAKFARGSGGAPILPARDLLGDGVFPHLRPRII